MALIIRNISGELALVPNNNMLRVQITPAEEGRDFRLEPSDARTLGEALVAHSKRWDG